MNLNHLSLRIGCFLPSLIIFNLFFGWIFLSPLHWFGLGAILILLLALNTLLLFRKVPVKHSSNRNIIDVESKVIK